ncbi:MAG: hypothetical protein HZB12_02015 [Candidatus Yonathbacteria bacterium]|nr:hypothetical protein [Candidatus Yonathbacteria bacterium]
MAALLCDTGGMNETPEQLEARLKICEAEIAGHTAVVDQKSREATTLQRDLAILKAKIDKAKAEIKARDLNITKLDGGIKQNQKKILTLAERLDSLNISLAKILREQRELESASTLQVLLSSQNLSDYFEDNDNYEQVEESMQNLFAEIKDTKSKTEKAKADLESKKTKEAALKAVQVIEKKKTEVLQNETDKVLTVTKGEEAKYKKLVAEKRMIAAEIKNRILKLTGGGELKFGDALALARIPEAKIGVRAAFLLAILTQESGMNGVIGSNLGRCFYNTPWKTPNGTVMATNQQASFLSIMTTIGRDPNTTPVSCPISRDGTYGGAMGPSQFMPTTWWDVGKQSGYMRRVEEVTGIAPASPFDNLSAFTGTALYLSDGMVGCRATYGSMQYNVEACASAKYYAGGNWKKFMKSYGAQVANRAESFQKDIDILDAQ